jgi:quinol monooxygenase YgiN
MGWGCPVMATVEYRIDPASREAFLTALERVARERKRDGAYAWGVFQDTADGGRFLETFLLDSWLEHLRQHKRVTNADRAAQVHVARFLKARVIVTHLIAAERANDIKASENPGNIH